jgi:hypothetical protein
MINSAGSASFSKASTASNDGIMHVIRGNIQAADIYLGDSMRHWNH